MRGFGGKAEECGKSVLDVRTCVSPTFTRSGLVSQVFAKCRLAFAGFTKCGLALPVFVRCGLAKEGRKDEK